MQFKKKNGLCLLSFNFFNKNTIFNKILFKL